VIVKLKDFNRLISSDLQQRCSDIYLLFFLVSDTIIFQTTAFQLPHKKDFSVTSRCHNCMLQGPNQWGSCPSTAWLLYWLL